MCKASQTESVSSDNSEMTYVSFISKLLRPHHKRLAIGLIAMFFIWRFFQEKTEKRPHAIDYRGTLLLGLLEGGPSYGWSAIETLTLFSVSALLAAFIVQEGRV